MRFADVVKGARAEKPIDVPVPGMKDGKVEAVVRALTSLEQVDVIAAATKFAQQKGIKDPTHGHPVFDAALYAETLLVTVLDKDSDPKARQRFFESAEQILGEFDPDTIAMLHQQQQLWQEEVSPMERAKSFTDLFTITKALAADGDSAARFFVAMSPRTLLVWSRTTARQLVTLPDFKSLFTPSSESGSPSSAPS